LGFSEWTPDQIQAAIAIAGPELFISSQPQYSMLWQAPQAQIFELCSTYGISQIVWSPLAEGLLTGKYPPGMKTPADSRAASDSMGGSIVRLMNHSTQSAVERLRPIAKSAHISMTELALAWVLRRTELASAIVGASRPEQVHANANASGIELTSQTLDAIEQALGDVPVKEPTLAMFAPVGIRYRS
jgi:aryl-alcohol dehydrogenase-like predicted oxidoreductase